MLVEESDDTTDTFLHLDGARESEGSLKHTKQ